MLAQIEELDRKLQDFQSQCEGFKQQVDVLTNEKRGLVQKYDTTLVSIVLIYRERATKCSQFAFTSRLNSKKPSFLAQTFTLRKIFSKYSRMSLFVATLLRLSFLFRSLHARSLEKMSSLR